MKLNQVSIPFKREGLPELMERAVGIRVYLFLFPSNGKDFQNMGVRGLPRLTITSFYSLQTGRTSRTHTEVH